MVNWEFRLNEKAAWFWQCMTADRKAVLERCQQEFQTLQLCVHDASKHGYKVVSYAAASE